MIRQPGYRERKLSDLAAAGVLVLSSLALLAAMVALFVHRNRADVAQIQNILAQAHLDSLEARERARRELG